MSDALPPRVIIELFAQILRDHPPPESQAIYEYRKYADRLASALERVSLRMVNQPKIVRLRQVDRRSTAMTRQAAQRAWVKRMDETGDQIAALEAALRETLAREPRWSLEDAVRHTLKFVVG